MRPKLNVRVDPGLLERIDALAAAEGKYRSLLVQALLNDAMDLREFGGSYRVPSDEERKSFRGPKADQVIVDEPVRDYVPDNVLREMTKEQLEWTERGQVLADELEKAHPTNDDGTVTFNAAEPHPGPSHRHFHRYDPEHFLSEARPERGIRMGTYKCSCGKVTKQPLDDWNRAAADQEAKR